MDAVETIGLRKAYGPRTVLAGVDLTVARGSVFALLGPNGAGKTTAVRILATLQPPDGGRARVCGHDVVAEPAAVRRSISLTGQFAAVDEQLTAEENLLLMGRLRHLGRTERRRRTDELLDLLELTADARRRVKGFSGGMRRKVDLAMSLISRPEVLFLDEPTTGLDPRSRQAVWDVVAGLVTDGVTVFLTTQYLEEADRLADRIAVLDGGTVVATGSADELKRRLGTEQVELVLDGAADPALVLLGDAVVRSEAHTVWVATDGSAAHLRHVLDTLAGGGVGVATATPRRPTLDDVFLTLTGSGRARPDATDPTRPDLTGPDPTQPTRPDATRSDPTRSDATGPDSTLEGASR